MNVDAFILHFCAHVCASYFVCDQAYAFLYRSKLSYFSTLFLSILIAFVAGMAYKCVEAYTMGHFVYLVQALTYNGTGILIAVNKILAHVEGQK
jgi:hypothetical protein